MDKYTSTFIIAICILITFGCGGTSGGDTGNDIFPTDNNQIIHAASVSGDKQSETVGRELPLPLVALITRSDGSPIASQTVNFKVVLGGGSVFAGAATSDMDGLVRERWTLGTLAGEQKIEVRTVDSTGSALVLTAFTANATPDSPQIISISSGDNQRAVQTQQLPSPITVSVEDQYGNPNQGVSVEFVANNDGVVSPSIATTNTFGEVSSVWTLGPAIGAQTSQAYVTGFSPLTFTATATRAAPGAATSIVAESGGDQTVLQHLLLPQPLIVRVTDALNNPVPDMPVTFSTPGESAYIQPTVVNTNLSGRSLYQGYFHTAGQQKVIASVEGSLDITFNISVTPSSHLYDGYYSCEYDQSGSFFVEFDVVEGKTSEADGLGKYYPIASGEINESNGIVDMVVRVAASYYVKMDGQFAIDSLGRSSGPAVVTENGIASDLTCRRK